MKDTNVLRDYESFAVQRETLSKLLASSQSVFRDLDMEARLDTICKLTTRLASDRFKVLILGEFKRGKSTVINAILGADILPAFATPCTAVINEIKWSESKRAVLHFRSPLPSPLPQQTPPAVIRHVQQANGDGLPPICTF
jgi:ribosome biogenesis GTPase A